jgi:SAM-dependent methyltransferase
MDVVDLREFYASRLGNTTRRTIANRLRGLGVTKMGETVMGLGYALPYLDEFSADARRVLAFMPARQGVVQWPEQDKIRSVLVDELDLPLVESAIDLAIVVHGLEASDAPDQLLRELWRVLSPQGRLMLVVPNRRGLWARFDSSPFGQGQPFSRPQLSKALREAQFSVQTWDQALYFPPVTGSVVLAMAGLLEATGRAAMPAVAGVMIVEAVKQVYAISPGKRQRRLVPQLPPVLAPLPVPQGRLGLE